MLESVTLEQKILEDEKNGTIFETELFKHIYKEVREAGEEVDRKALSLALKEGLVKFIKELHPESPIEENVIESTFYAATAVCLGGEFLRSKGCVKTEAIKRIIRKENMIGFKLDFADGTKGGAIMPKEQYESLIEQGMALPQIINTHTDYKKEISNINTMDDDELNKMLEISATKILEGGLNE